MADTERPPGKGGADRKWLYAGLAAGGLAFVYVWWKNRGGASSSTSSDTGATDSAGGSATPTDMRDIIQVNYTNPPADKEDNQPTTHHKPKTKPKTKPKPRRHVPPRREAA